MATKLGNVSEAARQLGISRQALSKWISRLSRANFQLKGLRERSRRPKKRDRKRTSRQTEKKIKQLKKKRRLGSLQIKMALHQDGIQVGKTTIQHIMNGRKKPLKKVRSRRATHKKRYELPIPGQRMQIDVKYGPLLSNGKRPYVYVAVDECTRWRFARAYPELNHFMTEDFLNRLKTRAPFPLQHLQTDNGFEFTFRLSVGEKAMHRMKHWCERFRIHHRLIPPGVKELNGKVERSHRIEDRFLEAKNHFLKIMSIVPLDKTDTLLRELKAQLTIYNDYCGVPLLPMSRPVHARTSIPCP
ncbi:MAG: integrase core domain protein [Bacteriovoracaceae bacterium]|nr:integrase core domain protein [Bacteriovoracaceae bacterium]